MGGSNSTRNPENGVPFHQNKKRERYKDYFCHSESGKETVEGLAGKPEESEPRNYFRDRLLVHCEDEMHVLRHFDWLEGERAKEDKKVKEEAEKIKTETKELSQKPESDLQVVETAEFVTKMTEEILEQKARLTKSNVNESGKRSNPQNREDGVFERLRNNNSADHSLGPRPKLRTKRAADENMEDCAQQSKYHDVLKGDYHKSISLKDEKGMSADQTITTCHPELANNSGSLKDVCCDVKKYIQQISRLVQEKICNLPEEVRKKLESVVTSFQRLILGMWKLLLYDLLLYEMTSIFASYQREKKSISRKKSRFKYSFQMASMMALWLAHDVESNPGPSYDIRSCLERITRQLSEALRYHLPVEGSLWSESVAEAAYAAGYSTDCKWSNPSGYKKDKLMLLIERATELGRVLTTLDCLPTELAPFVNDLGNYAVQEQLVIHYKVENLMSAVDIVLGIGSLGDEHKQAIMHKIQRLKQISEVPHSLDFERLADSSTKGSHSFGSTVYAIDSNMTINQPDDIGNDDILILRDQNVLDDDARNAVGPRTATNSPEMTQQQVTEVETISPTGSISTGQGQEVKQQKTVDNLNDQVTTNLETPTYVLSTNPPVLREVVPFPPEGDQACQTHDAHTNEQKETERINYACPLNYDDQIMELLKLIPGQNAYCMENNSWPAERNGNGVEESSMNINPDITESDKGSDSTLQENTGEDGTINYLERDRDNLTQEGAEAEEHITEDDDSIEHFVQGEQIAKPGSETEFLQQTISPLATGSNNCHEAVGDEVTSVNGGRRTGAEGDTCENVAETLSPGGEQFAVEEIETEPIQQTIYPLTAVTQNYQDTNRDEMYREETFDDNTSGTQENKAEDLTLGTEQFASTEPADAGKRHMELTAEERFAEFKASLLEEVDARLEAFKATLGNNTPNEHVVQNENGEPLDCTSSDVEHTETRSSYSSRKRNLTDPENGPISKKWKQ